MWLVLRLARDFKTNADFRRDNDSAIRRSAHFAARCKKFNLFSERVAVRP
jgi:hypothetical protein